MRTRAIPAAMSYAEADCSSCTTDAIALRSHEFEGNLADVTPGDHASIRLDRLRGYQGCQASPESSGQDHTRLRRNAFLAVADLTTGLFDMPSRAHPSRRLRVCRTNSRPVAALPNRLPLGHTNRVANPSRDG